MRPTLLIPLLCLLSVASLLLGLTSGSLDISGPALWHSLWGQQGGIEQRVVLELRLPRVAAAFVTGGLLALAGALMQVLLRNPLADPYILGISGGAAVGALGAMLLGLSGAWLSGSALAGALLSMGLVFGLAHGRGAWTAERLLLTGVVVAAGWGAVIGFMLTASPEAGLRGMLFWLMGDLSHSGAPWPGLGLLVAGLLLAMGVGRSLNILARGELQAAALGVGVARLRLTVYVLASLLTATAVTLAGSIGFVGLVVPHLLRLLGLRDHRSLLPATVLLGGSLLVLADSLARSLLAPQQLPVGVLTALIGVPVFLYLLHRSARLAGNGA